MRLLVLLSASLLAIGLLVQIGSNGAAAQSPTTPATVQSFAPAAITVTVQVGPNSTTSYDPSTQTVSMGDSVHWVWSSTFIPHSVTSGTCVGITCTPDGKFDSNGGIPQTAPNSYDFTFTTPGVYPYYCRVHLSGMQGSIIVVAPRAYMPLVIR